MKERLAAVWLALGMSALACAIWRLADQFGELVFLVWMFRFVTVLLATCASVVVTGAVLWDGAGGKEFRLPNLTFRYGHYVLVLALYSYFLPSFSEFAAKPWFVWLLLFPSLLAVFSGRILRAAK